MTLHWRHNGHRGVSNHWQLECLVNCLFGPASNKHQSQRCCPFVRRIHRWPVHRWIPLTKGQQQGKPFRARTLLWMSSGMLPEASFHLSKQNDWIKDRAKPSIMCTSRLPMKCVVKWRTMEKGKRENYKNKHLNNLFDPFVKSQNWKMPCICLLIREVTITTQIINNYPNKQSAINCTLLEASDSNNVAHGIY